MELVKTQGLPPLEAFEMDLASLSEGTQRLYRRWLSNFFKYTKGTPEELIEAINGADNRALALKSVRKTIEKYQAELVAGGLNPNTVTVIAKAVTKFLSANEINDFKMKAGSAGQSSGKRVLQREQIVSLHEDAGKSRRLRALVMVIKDTGLRPSDVANMKVEDFVNAQRIQTENGEFRAWVEPQMTKKNKVYAYIHLGPESIKALNDYIGERTEGPLFLTERSMPKKNGGPPTQAGEPMTSINITTCMRNLCKRLKAEGYNVSAISLRKYFFTNLSTRFELAHCKILAGKALPATDKPYLQSALDGSLTKLYVQHYDALRIFGEASYQTREELKTIAERLDDREGQLNSVLDTVFQLQDLIMKTQGLTQEQLNAKLKGTYIQAPPKEEE